MSVVCVNNDVHVIMEDSDITEIIDKYCGSELSRIVANKIIEMDAEKLYAKEIAATDADAYLSDLESKESCLHDILDIVEELEDYITESKRINKDKIRERIQEIERLIGNEI